MAAVARQHGEQQHWHWLSWFLWLGRRPARDNRSPSEVTCLALRHPGGAGVGGVNRDDGSARPAERTGRRSGRHNRVDAHDRRSRACRSSEEARPPMVAWVISSKRRAAIRARPRLPAPVAANDMIGGSIEVHGSCGGNGRSRPGPAFIAPASCRRVPDHVRPTPARDCSPVALPVRRAIGCGPRGRTDGERRDPAPEGRHRISSPVWRRSATCHRSWASPTARAPPRTANRLAPCCPGHGLRWTRPKSRQDDSRSWSQTSRATLVTPAKRPWSKRRGVTRRAS
jgi:hypothetical protein